MNIEFLNVILIKAGWLLLLILLDLFLGVVTALKNKEFTAKRLSEFLSSNAPKLLGWLVLEVITQFPTELQIVLGFISSFATLAYVSILVSTGASIFGHLSKLGFTFNKVGK